MTKKATKTPHNPTTTPIPKLNLLQLTGFKFDKQENDAKGELSPVSTPRSSRSSAPSSSRGSSSL